MSNKATSLKAKIRNLSKETNVPAQVLLQNYMFERFLERLSILNFKDNFILKGGMLIGSLVGISNRSTMDMDATIRNYPLTETSIISAINEICSIKIDDGVKFSYKRIIKTREVDKYGGYRININGDYDTINTPLSIDISVGDVITPKEIIYSYEMIFEEKIINIWAYNLETILAEKVETILQRGELNTRPRDFYDVFILSKTQKFDHSIFIEALNKTTKHRETSYLLNDYLKRIEIIESSEILQYRWKKYTEDYSYAKNIQYKDTINSLRMLLDSNE